MCRYWPELLGLAAVDREVDRSNEFVLKEIMSLSKNPKDTPWKSLKYRRWLRDNCHCPICKKSLTTLPSSYQGHHHHHSGGKRPRDHLIVSLCHECHSRLHDNESWFNEEKKMTEEKWLTHIMGNLIEYAEALNINSRWVAINALREVIQEAENDS